MTTRKGIFNTLVGVIMTIIISIFQLIFLFVLNSQYEGQFVGLVRVIISFLTYLSLTEGGLGLITIFALYRPLQNGDYETVNDIINTTRKNYRHTGKIYALVIVAIAVGLGLVKNFSPGLIPGLTLKISAWEFALIIIFLSSKELLFFYFSGAYQNLIQADQRGYLNRLVFIFSEVIMYILLIALISVPKMPIFVPFIAYAVCGSFKSLFTFIIIKIEYPWLQHKKWIQQKRLLKQSWWIALSRIPEMTIANLDVILITLFLGLNVTSIYTYYLILAATIRNIALILISSFREVFGYWIAKSGRIRWSTYTKFEMYAYMVAAFCFMCQFLITQYVIGGIYGQQYSKSNDASNQIFFQYFLNSPTFILIFSLRTMFEVATEPGRVIVNATVKHKETIWSSYIQAFIVLSLAIAFGATLRYTGYPDWSLYMIILTIAIGWIYRLISIWIFVWKHLTYNSDLRYIVQNALILFVPIFIAILVGYLYLFKEHPPTNSIKHPSLTLNIFGYTLLGNLIVVLFTSMTINFKHFWAIFNVKAFFVSIFSRKKMSRINKKIQDPEIRDLFKDDPTFLKNLSQTLDFTSTYQINNNNIDELLEQELIKKDSFEKSKHKKSDVAQVGIYKIRG